MFSDGVIAIIITLMIIDIKLPDLTANNFWLLAEHLAVYGLSFVVIAITWLNHHNMFLPVEKVNVSIIWINFMLLFFMSLIPLATQPLGEHFFKKESHMFYGAVLTGVSFAYSLLQMKVSKTLTHAMEKDKKKLNQLNWAATMLYALSVPLSSLSIYLSAFIFIMFPVIYFIPSKPLTKKN